MEQTEIKLDDKGRFNLKLTDSGLRPITPREVFVINMGDKVLLLFSEKKHTKEEIDNKFQEIEFNSIIVLNNKLANSLPKLIENSFNSKPGSKKI